jgi:hypothetical protein
MNKQWKKLKEEITKRMKNYEKPLLNEKDAYALCVSLGAKGAYGNILELMKTLEEKK